jgi:hypothetical protein
MNAPTTPHEAYVYTTLQAIFTPDDGAALEAMIWAELYAAQLSHRERRTAEAQVDRMAEAMLGPRST